MKFGMRTDVASAFAWLLAAPLLLAEPPPLPSASVPPPAIKQRGYGETLHSPDPTVALWWASSGHKIGLDVPPPAKRGVAARLSVAANEAEGVQIVVRPGRPLANFLATASVFKTDAGDVLPAGAIELFRVRYINVMVITDDFGEVGHWPDPLPPFKKGISVPAKTNQPVWMRISVPTNVKRGVYKGTVSLTAEGFKADVKVEAEVYGFALPDQTTVRSTFGLGMEAVFARQKITDKRQQREVTEKYMANMAAHRISPYEPFQNDRYTYRFEINGNRPNPRTEVIFDWTAWDRAVVTARDKYHFNTFVIYDIPGLGGMDYKDNPGKILGYTNGTAEHEQLFKLWCKAALVHFKELGVMGMVVASPFDEPVPEHYAHIRRQAKLVRDNLPGVHILVPQAMPLTNELIGSLTYWSPRIDLYQKEFMDKRREAGEIVTWYLACFPHAPYLNAFIDRPGTELRTWLWLTWKEKLQGILYWHINYWTNRAGDKGFFQDPYEDPMSYVYSGYEGTTLIYWGNADGRLIYPPEGATGLQKETVLDGPVDSVRWESLRDGVEDYEYLAMLKRLLAEKSSKLSIKDRESFSELLVVPKSIGVSPVDYGTLPEPILKRRDEIAKAIEKLILAK